MTNNMSGAMFLMLKKSADRRQRDALEEAFKRADVNSDGKLSLEEYYAIMRNHGVECSREEIKQIMSIADKDHDGFISREEFLDGGRRSSSSNVVNPDSETKESKKADTAFKVFDQNHDGYVTKEEMLHVSKNITRKQVDAVFALNDDNHDGRLNRDEFQGFMQSATSNRKKTKP